MFDMKMFDEFKFYGNLLMLRFYKEIKCLKWKCLMSSNFMEIF